ncbi:MAG: FtsQ-type POTRA domain-containing protein [Hydrogenophilus sp.]|nr:FtsQ-type POTRA domain-containing protein [Hydrogenophilus sp.]
MNQWKRTTFWVWDWGTRLVLGGLFVLWGGVIGPGVMNRWLPPVREVEVRVEQGGSLLDGRAIEEILLSQTSHRLLWQVDLYTLRQALLAVPAVREVRLERVWPDRLLVVLRGREPFLRWYDPENRTYWWLDETARPFQGAVDPRESALPLVVAEREAMEGALALLSLLLSEMPAGWRLKELRFSTLGAVTIEWEGKGEWRLGRVPSAAAAVQRVRWLRQQWDQLVAILGRPPAAVDLRYERAFAVEVGEGETAVQEGVR